MALRGRLPRSARIRHAEASLTSLPGQVSGRPGPTPRITWRANTRRRSLAVPPPPGQEPCQTTQRCCCPLWGSRSVPRRRQRGQTPSSSGAERARAVATYSAKGNRQGRTATEADTAWHARWRLARAGSASDFTTPNARGSRKRRTQDWRRQLNDVLYTPLGITSSFNS